MGNHNLFYFYVLLQQLIGTFRFRFRFLCLLKTKTNNSSLELSINGLTQIADGKPVSTPNSEFKNKPVQGGTYFLFPLLIFNSIPLEVIITDMGVSQTDPFIYNLCMLYVTICQLATLVTAFIFYVGLCGIIYYIYCNKLTSLKTFIDNKKILKWCLSVVVLVTLVSKLDIYVRAIFLNMSKVITFINTYNLLNFYINPPGLAMGSSRVLHIESYSWPFKYLNKIVDLNPDYILTYITFIKYLYIFIIAIYFYMFIACFTTGIYSQDKMALSLPGGPGTLNLFTKCFYLKKPYKVIFITLVIITLMLILVSYLLFVYINIYVKG